MSCCSGSGSSVVFRLRPLRRRWWRRRILALTMRVDEIVGIAGHLGEGRRARTTRALYVSVAAVVGGSSRSRKQASSRRLGKDGRERNGTDGANPTITHARTHQDTR